MQLTCPKCHGEMRQYERSGVVIDQCGECRGIFLDRGELEKLFEAEANWSRQQAGAPQRRAQPAPAPGRLPAPAAARRTSPVTAPSRRPPPPAHGYPPQPAYGHSQQQHHGYHGHYRARRSTASSAKCSADPRADIPPGSIDVSARAHRPPGIDGRRAAIRHSAQAAFA